jgi:hypothetical protein
MRAKKTDEMTEIELQRSIAENMRTSVQLQKKIKGWVQFIGILYIIGLAGLILSSINTAP